MRPSDMLNLITARFKAAIKRPVYIEGSPGIGKTSVPAQAAAQLGIGCMIVHAPLMQPEDTGLPTFAADRESFKFVVNPDMFPLVGSGCPDTGIFIIDELAQADNNIQKILRNLILERVIHGRALKPGWTIVSTGNRVSDRAGANRLLSHMSNSLTRIELEVSLDDWTQWALQNDVKPEVIAFIRFRPALLNMFDANVEINPTPRAWVQGVSAALGTIDAHLEFETFRGDVGEGAAAEFTAFLKIYRKLPSPDAVLLNPKTADVPVDPATVYAICGAMSFRTTKDNFGRVMEYISRLPAEFTVLFVRDVLKRTPAVQESKEFIAWVSGPGAKLLM